MEAEEFELADLAIKELDAQERVVDANVAAYPHMPRDSSEKFMRGLHRLAYPAEKAVTVVTPEQLKGMGFG